MVVAFGIALGLVAAFLQSVCYVISGGYVKRTGLPGWTLTAPQRAVMILPYAILAWMFRPDSMQGLERGLFASTFACVVAIFTADSGLFQMQKHVEPSRTAPLQSVKIPILALMSFLAFGQSFSFLQIIGIALVLASAALLFGAGRRIPLPAWLWLLLCTGCYAVSDLSIGHALDLTRDACGGVLRSSLFVLGITHLACSVFAVPVLVVQRLFGAPMPGLREWLRYAVPYGFVWMVAMVFLLSCFSLSGVVLGAIAQSCRGLISVLLGWLLVRHGFADLEGETPRTVFLRRIFAAVMIVIAMALYAS